MHIIAAVNQKGGAGKSTLALHLAVAAEAAALGPIALIDTDPQGTLMRWWEQREANTPAMAQATLKDLPGKLSQLADAGYRWVFIDTPGRSSQANEEIIELASLVLIPVKPSSADLWATAATVAACDRKARPYVFVVCQATRGAVSTIQAVSALSEHGTVAPVVVHNRVGFATSLAGGHTIQELDPKGAGAHEIADLLAFSQRRLVEIANGGLAEVAKSGNQRRKQYA